MRINPYSKQIAKLHHPPAAPNWVRFVESTELKTAKRILAWLNGRPSFTYRPGYASAKDTIELGISLDAAVRAATLNGAPAGKEANKELAIAHHAYATLRGYRPQNIIDFHPEYFRVSRNLTVPVAPLSIIREKGRFVPIFLCGWKSIPLSAFQRRLLMTIYDDAFLSLTDFRDSPAEFLFYPKNSDGTREVEKWDRGDYALLTQSEVNDAVMVFIRALSTIEVELSVKAKEWKPADEKDKNDEHPSFL